MAQYEEITIDQGTDVSITINCVDNTGAKKDLTNYTAYAKLKKNYNSDSDDTTTFSAAIPAPYTDGVITLGLTNVQTDALRQGRYVYDVEISYIDSAGDTIIERILEGRAQVTPSVTR